MTDPKFVESIHIAFRVGAFLFWKMDIDVVEAHNSIVQQHGSVLFGSSGRRMSDNRLRLIQLSVRQGSPKFFLIKKQGRSFQVWDAPLLRVLPGRKRADRRLVPAYYREETRTISTWFEIGELGRASPATLELLVLVSNGHSLRRVLETSRTALMLVVGRSPSSAELDLDEKSADDEPGGRDNRRVYGVESPLNLRR